MLSSKDFMNLLQVKYSKLHVPRCNESYCTVQCTMYCTSIIEHRRKCLSTLFIYVSCMYPFLGNALLFDPAVITN
jgi:hypothetical protein